jgi:CSLREA domain-containing protein
MTRLVTRWLGGALLALVLGLMLAGGARAASFVVNSSADPGDGVCDASNCTLREAIAAANANGESDTITFDLDADDREILLGGTRLEIANDAADPDLTIDGAGAPDVTVDGGGNSQVFSVHVGANATLRGLVITGGITIDPDGTNSDGDGGGILNRGTLTIDRSTITENFSDRDGGGVSNIESGTLTITDSTISDNRADNGGGGIHNFATLTVTGSRLPATDPGPRAAAS